MNCSFIVLDFQESQFSSGKYVNLTLWSKAGIIFYSCRLLLFHIVLCYKFQVFRTALSNRLAKVQGFLFRAAFLRRAPLFLRLISENILLCFMLSTMHSTSKYITGALSLRFRKILTKLIHSHYFEVATASSEWRQYNFLPLLYARMF